MQYFLCVLLFVHKLSKCKLRCALTNRIVVFVFSVKNVVHLSDVAFLFKSVLVNIYLFESV